MHFAAVSFFGLGERSLERFGHDNKIPDIFYTVSVENGRQTSSGNRIFDHLPADEDVSECRPVSLYSCFFRPPFSLLASELL